MVHKSIQYSFVSITLAWSPLRVPKCVKVIQVLLTLFIYVNESNMYVANSELEFFMNEDVMNNTLLCKIYLSLNLLKFMFALISNIK
jgi:hypothetical protein